MTDEQPPCTSDRTTRSSTGPTSAARCGRSSPAARPRSTTGSSTCPSRSRATPARGPARHLEAQRHPAGHHPGQRRQPDRELIRAEPGDPRCRPAQFAVDIPGRRRVRARSPARGRTSSCGLSDPFLFAGRGDTAAVRGPRRGARAERALGDRRRPVRSAGHPGRRPHPLVAAPGDRVAAHPHRTRCRTVVAGPGRARASAARALPSSDLVPPATLLPLAAHAAAPRARGRHDA